MNAILFLLGLIAVFVVLPAFIGSLIGYGMSGKRPRIKPRARNVKLRPDVLKAVRLGQTLLF